MSMVSLRSPSTIASASFSSRPARRRIQPARLCTMSRIMSSLASSVRPAQVTMPSTSGTWRSSVIAASSVWPSRGAISIRRMRSATAVLTMPPRCSWSSASRMSASRRDPPRRSRPSLPAGWLRKRPIAPATSRLFIRRATTEGVRKLSLRNWASVSPILSLLRGMIAVCGIGSPSGWRNRAVTANQSAMPPTSPASAKARTKPQAGWRWSSRVAAMKIAAMPASIAVASARMPRALCAGEKRPRPVRRNRLMPVQ